MTPVMLYLHFALYGFLCFGGGYMLIPFITADLVNGGYLSQAEFANLSSIAQITPGPIGLNTATYVGYLQSGFPGSLLASLGLVTPAFLMDFTADSSSVDTAISQSSLAPAELFPTTFAELIQLR